MCARAMSTPLTIHTVADPLGITTRRIAREAGLYKGGDPMLPGISSVLPLKSRPFIGNNRTINPLLADILQTVLHSCAFLKTSRTYTPEEAVDVATSIAGDSVAADSLLDAVSKLDISDLNLTATGVLNTDDAESPPGVNQLYMHLIKHAVGKRVCMLVLFPLYTRCFAVIGELGQPYVLIDAQRSVVCELSSPMSAIPAYITNECLPADSPEPSYSVLVLAPLEEEEENPPSSPVSKRKASPTVATAATEFADEPEEPVPAPETKKARVAMEPVSDDIEDDEDDDDDNAAAAAAAEAEEADGDNTPAEKKEEEEDGEEGEEAREEDSLMAAMKLKPRRSRRKRTR